MRIRKVLSLFNGLSGGRLALAYSLIPIEEYLYSEIDKYGNAVSKYHWPSDVPLGDIMDWREWDIDWSEIDLFMGGSPCQGFSAAGKQGGTKAILDGEEVVITDREMYLDAKERGAEFLSQSFLFWEYILCLDHVKKANPNVKFLLENVKMAKHNMDMITEAIGVEPMFINSALVSAQNRQRWYWFNWTVDQPEDKGIILRDILEDSENELKPCTLKEYDENALCHHVATADDINGHDCLKRVYNDTGKSPTLNACTGGNRETKLLVNESVSEDGKSYSLTKSYGGAVAWNSCERKQRTMVPVEESAKDDPNVYNGSLYRKLTPTECEALQTVPSDYTAFGVFENSSVKSISTSQRYKMLGNGWTIEVISHILNGLKEI